MITKRKAQDQKPTEQIGVRVDSDLYKKLEKIAETEERTIAQLARMALRDFVERRFSGQAA
jgi:predicted transcriptional regulator